jgi:hypothetical protein
MATPILCCAQISGPHVTGFENQHPAAAAGILIRRKIASTTAINICTGTGGNIDTTNPKATPPAKVFRVGFHSALSKTFTAIQSWSRLFLRCLG